MSESLPLAALALSIVAVGVAGMLAWLTRPASETHARLTRLEVELPAWREGMQRLYDETQATREEIAHRQKRIAGSVAREARTEQQQAEQAPPPPMTRRDRLASIKHRYQRG